MLNVGKTDHLIPALTLVAQSNIFFLTLEDTGKVLITQIYGIRLTRNMTSRQFMNQLLTYIFFEE